MGCAGSRLDSSLERDYKLKGVVGDGAEGTVWLGQSVTNGRKFALKVIPISTHSPSKNIDHKRNLLNEAQSMAWLGPGHVNIVRFEEVLLTEQHVVLAMEWASGGTLASHSRRRQIPEHEALYFFKQIVAAVEFCHGHHVAHRDLKLDNLLLDASTTPPRVKLADFGLSKHWEPASNRLARMNTCAGTPGYISPEVAGTILHAPGSTYDGPKADVWALGVALVGMLLHHLPFAYSQLRHLSVRALLRNMHHQQLHTRWLDAPAIREHLATLSPPLRDLLSRIFVPDAALRISIAAIRQHPWFTQPLPRRYQAALDAMDAEQALRGWQATGDDAVDFSASLRERLHVLQLRLERGGVAPGAVSRVVFHRFPAVPLQPAARRQQRRKQKQLAAAAGGGGRRQSQEGARQRRRRRSSRQQQQQQNEPDQQQQQQLQQQKVQQVVPDGKKRRTDAELAQQLAAGWPLGYRH